MQESELFEKECLPFREKGRRASKRRAVQIKHEREDILWADLKKDGTISPKKGGGGDYGVLGIVKLRRHQIDSQRERDRQ